MHCGGGYFPLGTHAALCVGDFSPANAMYHVEIQTELCSVKGRRLEETSVGYLLSLTGLGYYTYHIKTLLLV